MGPTQTLPLKAMHAGVAPAWWPPASGWWWLLGFVLLVLISVASVCWLRRRRLNTVARYFDREVLQAATPAAQVAVISELLRRAARAIDPQADRLLGDDWLRLLDQGMPVPVFLQGAGALLADGAYRREIDAESVAALQRVARQRFLLWMRRV